MNFVVKNFFRAALVSLSVDTSRAVLPEIREEAVEVAAELQNIPKLKPEAANNTKSSLFNSLSTNEKFYEKFRENANKLMHPEIHLGAESQSNRDRQLDFEALRISLSQWLREIDYFPRPRLKDNLIEAVSLEKPKLPAAQVLASKYVQAIFDRPLHLRGTDEKIISIKINYPEGSYLADAFQYSADVYNKMFSACADVAYQQLKQEDPETFLNQKTKASLMTYALAYIYMRTAIANIAEPEMKGVLTFLHYDAMLGHLLGEKINFQGINVAEVKAGDRDKITLAAFIQSERAIGDVGVTAAITNTQHISWRPEYFQILFDELRKGFQKLIDFFNEAVSQINKIRIMLNL